MRHRKLTSSPALSGCALLGFSGAESVGRHARGGYYLLRGRASTPTTLSLSRRSRELPSRGSRWAPEMWLAVGATAPRKAAPHAARLDSAESRCSAHCLLGAFRTTAIVHSSDQQATPRRNQRSPTPLQAQATPVLPAAQIACPRHHGRGCDTDAAIVSSGSSAAPPQRQACRPTAAAAAARPALASAALSCQHLTQQHTRRSHPRHTRNENGALGREP